MSMLVSEAIGSTLGLLEVDAVFGLMGDGNMRFLADLTRRRGIRYVAARHESAAVSMARGYAHVTGRPGVATVTQGPGLANCLTALIEVVRAGEPVLLIAGDSPVGARGHSQDVDQTAIVRAAGATPHTLRAPETIVEDLARAHHAAAARRTAVVLSVPADWQDRRVEDSPPPALAERLIARPAPDPAAVAAAADLVVASGRPVIIAGRGAARPDGRAVLESLGERIGALYATSVGGKGVFGASERCLGIAGGFATDLGKELIGGADLVIALGASLNRWTTHGGRLLLPSTRVVQCDVDPSAIGQHHPVTLGIVADCLSFARALTEELGRRGVRQTGYLTGEVRLRLAAHGPGFEDAGTGDGIDPRTLMLRLGEILPWERTVVTDGGLFSVWPLYHLEVPDAAAFDWGQAFQAVGLGIGAAIGAAVGRPQRRTVLIAGDGGLLMSLGDLETLVRHRLPVLVVVVNDGAYGAEVGQLRLLGLPDDLAHLGSVDFAAIAAGMGIPSTTVRSVADLEAAVPLLAGAGGPALVDCRVSGRVRDEWFARTFGPEPAASSRPPAAVPAGTAREGQG